MRRWSNDLWPLRLWQTDGQLFRQWPGVPRATGDPPNRRPDLFLPPLSPLSPRPNPSSPSCHLSVAVNTLAAGAASRPFSGAQPTIPAKAVGVSSTPSTNQPTSTEASCRHAAFEAGSWARAAPTSATRQRARYHDAPKNWALAWTFLRHVTLSARFKSSLPAPASSSPTLPWRFNVVANVWWCHNFFQTNVRVAAGVPCRICQSEKTCSLPRLERCLCSWWA